MSTVFKSLYRVDGIDSAVILNGASSYYRGLLEAWKGSIVKIARTSSMEVGTGDKFVCIEWAGIGHPPTHSEYRTQSFMILLSLLKTLG